MKKYSQLHESFYHEIFILEQNSRNYKSFLPQKFGAIRYIHTSSKDEMPTKQKYEIMRPRDSIAMRWGKRGL